MFTLGSIDDIMYSIFFMRVRYLSTILIFGYSIFILRMKKLSTYPILHSWNIWITCSVKTPKQILWLRTKERNKTIYNREREREHNPLKSPHILKFENFLISRIDPTWSVGLLLSEYQWKLLNVAINIPLAFYFIKEISNSWEWSWNASLHIELYYFQNNHSDKKTNWRYCVWIIDTKKVAGNASESSEK